MAPLSSLKTRQSLKSLGFSENEIVILTYLFQEKKGTARKISQHTAISFSTVQYSLANLTSQKLVKCLPNEEDHFQICSQKEFLEWIEKQKKTNQKVYEKAKNEVATFFQGLKEEDWKPEVRYFEGKEAMKTIYDELIEAAEKSDKKIYSWQDIQKVQELFGKYVKDYIKKRAEEDVISQAIMPKNKKNLAHIKKNEKREAKFIKDLKLEGQIRIAGNKVAFITLHRNKPVGFIFEGNIISQLFKAIFESSWESLD